jgi:hypothetical protein
VRARVALHQEVCPATDVLVRRDRAVSAQNQIEIRGLALRAGTGKEFKARNRRDGPRAREAVEVVRSGSAPSVTSTRMLVSTRYAISPADSVARPAHSVFVRYAVRDIIAFGPHAEDRQIPDGHGFRRNMHLDSSAFGEMHILQWFEDAVLVCSGNCQGCLPKSNYSVGGWRHLRRCVPMLAPNHKTNKFVQKRTFLARSTRWWQPPEMGRGAPLRGLGTICA